MNLHLIIVEYVGTEFVEWDMLNQMWICYTIEIDENVKRDKRVNLTLLNMWDCWNEFWICGCWLRYECEIIIKFNLWESWIFETVEWTIESDIWICYIVE